MRITTIISLATTVLAIAGLTSAESERRLRSGALEDIKVPIGVDDYNGILEDNYDDLENDLKDNRTPDRSRRLGSGIPYSKKCGYYKSKSNCHCCKTNCERDPHISSNGVAHCKTRCTNYYGRDLCIAKTPRNCRRCMDKCEDKFHTWSDRRHCKEHTCRAFYGRSTCKN